MQRAAIFFGSTALFRVQHSAYKKSEQLLEGPGVCAVPNECLFPFGRDELVVLQLLEVMRERRARHTGLSLDFVDDHAVGVG